ncbi:MAG: ribulose-phosphate 3-epimerase [Ruminococcaceae bacterium]|nr:ribulose-phosphate 3-epimerase [Oscillospiraceae bacterium]
MIMKVSPSILSCDFAHFGDQIRAVEEAGAEYIHIDVMDGVFVPNISLGPVMVKAVRPYASIVFDTHLMIVNPIKYVEEFAKAGADLITIHLESCDNVEETLLKIKSLGKKVGLSIKPKTPVSALEPYLPLLDLILIMSVEPGFGGQAYIPESTAKIAETAALIKKSGRDIELEVDGGISAANAKEVVDAGATVLVAGSAVFKAKDLKTGVDALRV